MVQTIEKRKHQDWKMLPRLSEKEKIRLAQPAPVQWSFTLPKCNSSSFGISQAKWNAKFGSDLSEIPLPQFDRLSIAEFHDKEHAESSSQYGDCKLEFIKGRFKLFADRINKRRKAIDPKLPMLETPLSGMAHYFRLKNKLHLLEEQEGEKIASRLFFVPKNRMLEESVRYTSDTDGRLDLEAVLDMIDRYVFLKLQWFGDIKFDLDVIMSERMIRQLEDNKADFKFEHFCLYLLMLGHGQNLLGITTDYQAPEINTSDTHRMQAHPEYLCTWLGFERLRKGLILGSAFVPRRVPKFVKLEDGQDKFDGFQLSHYAMLLGSCPEKPQVNNTEFFGDLPVARLEPFGRSNYVAALQKNRNDKNYYIDQVLGIDSFFKNFSFLFNSDAVLQHNYGHHSADQRQMYKLFTKFSFSFNSNVREMSFLQQKVCYTKNPESGLWEFEPKLATDAAFRAFVDDSMPQWFVAGVRTHFSKERLVLQKHVQSTHQTGTAIKDETINKMEKQCQTTNLVGQVLKMLPTLQSSLNVNQQKIMSAKNNLFILGRSGTGKTTTTVLRFFCQETLYCAFRKQQRLLSRYWLEGQMDLYRSQMKSLPALTSEDIKEETAMNMVFVTASPVLTNEVKQYYQNLKQQLASHLAKVKRVDEEHKNVADENVPEGDKTKLLNFIEQKEKEVVQAETLEQQLQLPNSFKNLHAKQFPLFLTVQRLVYMLDGALSRSFFSRGVDKKIIGMESSLGWHNEDQGVFMINQDFKQSDDVKRELEEFELQVLSGSAKQDNYKSHDEDFTMDVMSNVAPERMQVEKDYDDTNPNPDRLGALDKNYRSNKISKMNGLTAKNQRKAMRTVDNFPLCQEVTFEVFETRFIGRYYRFMTKKLSKKMSPTFLWTEFMSVIKGSINQEYQRTNFLSMREYLEKGSPTLTRKEKQTLFYLFLKYEEWKLNVRAFDFLDVVNHVLQAQLQSHGFQKQIDYLIIDEVQDLYPKTVKLLLSQTRYRVIFAGDTAQTIAKGVSVRISDMSRTLSSKMHLKTDQINLSVNYRSQNSILQLANNVVKLIETVFPDSIDTMTEEVSERSGLKPYILAPMGDKLLCQYFFGKTQEEAQVDDDFDIIDDDEEVDQAAKQQIPASVPHFGASQVVIVREQRVKEQLPPFMKSMLCLTVYESKGLEFDDVILFNFFAMGEIRSQQWKLLQGISEEKVIRGHIPDWVLDIDEDELTTFVEVAVSEAMQSYREERKKAKADDDQKLEETEESLAEEEKQEQLKMEKVRKDKTREYRRLRREAAIKKYEADGTNAEYIEEHNYQLDKKNLEFGELQRKFSQLCTELKFLYVAITRPKNRLFIYDENAQDRRPIEDIWERIDAVQWVTKEEVQRQLKEQTTDTTVAVDAKTDKVAAVLGTKPTAGARGTLSATGCDEKTWKFQGLRFLKQKNYQQAIKCFKYAGERELMLRCKAYIAAKDAQDMQSKVDSNSWEFKQRSVHVFSKRARKNKLEQLRKERLETCRLFHTAGVAFERATMTKLAASCFFTARSYSKAADHFKKLEMWSQAGESIACLGKNRLKEAAGYFEKGGLILRAIECFEQVQEWESLLHCLNRNQDKFGENERHSLINKYVPIALNNIYRQHGIVSQEDSDQVPVGDIGNIGQKVQARIQEKYKVQNEIQEEAAFDEYGEELIFNEDDESDDSSGEEVKRQDDKTSAEDIAPPKDTKDNNTKDDPTEEEEGENSDGEGADDDGGVMSKGFGLESLIKDQYKSQIDSLEKKEDDEASDEEVKGEAGSPEESFEVIDSEDDFKNQDEDGGPDQGHTMDLRDKIRESMMSDSFDHLSQYDPDDQLIRSDRSMSIIESFLSKDGKGSQRRPLSETSEFSIISSPNIKSIMTSVLGSSNDQDKQKVSQISFIDRDDDDNYMQDVIAQKIIYYLSLWSDDMRKQLATLKEKGILHEVDKHDQNETIDEADFIIQMDDVDQDFVNLILDTLEIYEFYHMSLMMCKRYHLSGRQGRYLVLMCSKYSNLNAFRADYLEKIPSKKFKQEQKVCSLLAHEAIHNVLGLIDADYLRMKPFGQELSDQNSLGIQAYQSILNLGFWKKLVYIMEKRQSLHLCLKFFDFTNFQVIMRAFMTQEEKIANRHLLDNWTIKAQLKSFLLLKQTIFGQLTRRRHYPELVQELEMSAKDTVGAVQLNQRTLQGMVDVQKKIGEMISASLDSLTMDERQVKIARIRGELDEIVSTSMQAFRHGDANSTDGAKYAGAVMIFDLIFNFSSAKFAQKIQKELLGSLSCLQATYKLLYDAFVKLDSLEAQIDDPVINALHSVLLISTLGEEYCAGADGEASTQRQNILGSYADSFMLVNINSAIIEDIYLLQHYQNDHELFTLGEKQYSKLSQKFYHKHELNKQISKDIDCARYDRSVLQWKADSPQSTAFVADMDAQFLYVPKSQILGILRARLAKAMVSFIYRGREQSLTLDVIGMQKRDQFLKTLTYANKNHLAQFVSKFRGNQGLKKSDFWGYMTLRLNHLNKIDMIISTYNLESQIRLLKKAKTQQITESQSGMIRVESLLTHYSANKKDPIDKVVFRNEIEKAFFLFQSVSGNKGCCIGDARQDVEEKLKELMHSFQKFVSIDHYIPFLELCRYVLKKANKVPNGKTSDTVIILKEVMRLIDCHVFIKNGQWSLASSQMLALSNIGTGPLTKMTSFTDMINCVEFAAYTTFMVKFGESCLPDYALHYLDKETNFKIYYGDGEMLDLVKRQSSEQTASKLKKSHKLGKSKGGFGRKEQGMVYDYDCEDDDDNYDYYQETEDHNLAVTHNEDDAGDEDSFRPIFERKVGNDILVEQVDKAAEQRQYETILAKLVHLIDMINADELAFGFKPELQRIYNILMAVVVNDKKKTKKVAQLLGQGFNRLVVGPYDDYFFELGVLEEWSSSATGNLLSASDFEAQLLEFEASEDGLKWQWYTAIEAESFLTIATGYYVAKIDLSLGKTADNQQVIRMKERQSILFEQRQLALRMASAHLICRAFRRILDKIKLQRHKKVQKMSRNKVIVVNQNSSSEDQQDLRQVSAYAMAHHIQALLSIHQVDSADYIRKLMWVQRKRNYFQELMVAKVFTNSIEISKAVDFMTRLGRLHAEYCKKAVLFAREQSEILDQFDMLEDDALSPVRTELAQEISKIDLQINSWLIHVFRGDSSGLALKTILQTQNMAQKRLKLKWQQIKPQTNQQRLKFFKRMKDRGNN